MSKSTINLALLNVNPQIVSNIARNAKREVGGARVLEGPTPTTPKPPASGGSDFDTPTINDNCFSAGTTTFTSKCEWNGFWH